MEESGRTGALLLRVGGSGFVFDDGMEDLEAGALFVRPRSAAIWLLGRDS